MSQTPATPPEDTRDPTAGQKLGFPSGALARAFCAELSGRHGFADRKVEELCHRARWLGEPLADLILREKLLSGEDLRDALAAIGGVPTVSLADIRISPEAVARVPVATVSRCRIMPLQIREEHIVLACDRLVAHSETEQLHVLLGCPVEWRLCTANELSQSIKHFYGIGLQSFLDIDARRRKGDDQETGTEHVSSGMSEFVGQLLDDAIGANATDIHIEPLEEGLRVRFRIDGLLYPVTLPAGAEQYRRSIVSSIKVMAQINIAERRLPQDGRFTRVAEGNPYDIRVSVMPARHGETLSLRILNRQSTFLDIEELGFNTQQRAEMGDLIEVANGIVLFTGPTGSGKTTSLYATLARLNTEERKIITLEDPVEYDLAGVTQMQVQPEIGFTFPSGLRSILRHDPDVILIGEIRDAETARIAVGSSLTGHLVLSTLHTQSAAASVVRLMDMGIEPYLVAASLQGMIAQRLLRRICRTCREEYFEEAAVEAEALALFPAAQPRFRSTGDAAARTAGSPATAAARPFSRCF